MSDKFTEEAEEEEEERIIIIIIIIIIIRNGVNTICPPTSFGGHNKYYSFRISGRYHEKMLTTTYVHHLTI